MASNRILRGLSFKIIIPDIYFIIIFFCHIQIWEPIRQRSRDSMESGDLPEPKGRKPSLPGEGLANNGKASNQNLRRQNS